MAILVAPENLQKMEFDVTTAEGPSRVTVVTGAFNVWMSAATGSSGPEISQNASFKAVLDPALTPGQFRKATATASFGCIQAGATVPPQSQTQWLWLISDAQATYDDEAGKVQLIVDATVTALGNDAYANLQRIMFQATTLAKV
jgi:hypothetical protein